MEKDKSDLECLVKQCISLTNKQGKIVSKGGSLLCAWMAIRYVGKDIVSFLELVWYPFSDGYCSVKVQEKGVLVLEAYGRYAPVPYDLKVHTYQLGSWEESLLRNGI